MIEVNGDQRPTILALSIAFPIISVLAVIFRFEARRVKRVYLGPDDWSILAALILALGLTYDLVLDSRLGRLGWHSVFTSDGAPLHDDTYVAFRKTTYALEVLYLPCVGLTKISVLLFYKRIFIDRPFQIIVWCFIGLCTAWMIAFEFAMTSFRWTQSLDRTCVGQSSLATAALSADVMTDGLILLLPIYNVWKLHMRPRQKIAVIAIFLLGGFTTVTGILRLQFLPYAFSSRGHPLFHDRSYHSASLFNWLIAQTNTGILSACLPTLRPLLEAYPPSSLLSIVTRPFSNVFRSTLHSSADVRLNSGEHGLNEVQSKDSAVYQSNSRAGSDDSFPPSIPEGILYQRK